MFQVEILNYKKHRSHTDRIASSLKPNSLKAVRLKKEKLKVFKFTPTRPSLSQVLNVDKFYVYSPGYLRHADHLVELVKPLSRFQV